MSLKGDGIAFEELVANIHRKILEKHPESELQHNVHVDGPDGPRQVDILVTSKIGLYNVTTIIECKDYKRAITIATIDEFHSKLIDLKANLGILVSSKGFSQKAINKAKRYNITLCTAHKAASPKWEIKLPIQVMLIGYRITNCSFSFTSKQEATLNTKFGVIINGRTMGDWLSSIWNAQLATFDSKEEVFIYTHDCEEEVQISDCEGNHVGLSAFEIRYNTEKVYRAGIVDDIDEAMMLINLSEKNASLLMSNQQIIDSQANLKLYTDPKDIPDGHYICTEATHYLPNLSSSPVEYNLGGKNITR